MAIQRVIAEVGGPRAASAVGLGIHVAECLVGDAPGNAQIAFEGKRDAWEVLASAGGFVQRDSFNATLSRIALWRDDTKRGPLDFLGPSPGGAS